MAVSPIPTLLVREHLEKILASTMFARSHRMGRFLRYTVELALTGHADEIKEYRIGVDVFDRRPDYDPRVDPIVRVEARRLREKLCAYYGGDGSGDQLQIVYEKGSYVPCFEPRAPEPPEQAAGQAPQARTIALLPFADLGPGTGHEYFSDGLTEELIHALTRVEELCVVAWNTAAHFRGERQDPRAVGEQLRVATVLTGSVRISGKRLRVTAQLIETASGLYLWSETYDRELSDVFAIQEEIAQSIVRTLRVELSGRQGAAPITRAGTNIDAYDLYLKGRYHWNKRTADDLSRSIHLFRGALALDEGSALAYAGLADAYSLLADYAFQSPEESIPKARAAAQKAIELDSGLGEAWTSLAFIRSLYDWEWHEAGELYARAIQLNPGYATAHFWRGVDYFALLGRFEEAAASVDRGLALDPLSPPLRDGRGTLYIMSREYAAALDYFRALSRSLPGYFRAWTSLGRTLAQIGEYAQALESLERGHSLAGDIPNILAAMGQVHALAGRPELAREYLARLHKLARVRHVHSAGFAIIHMALGETGQALDWLEGGCSRRELPLGSLRVHPVYDPLRAEPRFRRILARIWPDLSVAAPAV